MEAEIENFNLIPSVYDDHQDCIFVIWQLEERLKGPESNTVNCKGRKGKNDETF